MSWEIEQKEIPEFFKRFKNKKYCLHIFLKNPTNINPFEINKTGFGAMSSWITIDNVLRIKKIIPADKRIKSKSIIGKGNKD